MSDGPHRSLPMRPGWKRVAEFSDNMAFSSGEIAKAVVPALVQDLRHEVKPVVLDEAYRLFRRHESSLFKDSLPEQLQHLRRNAGSGLEKSLLDHAMVVAERGISGRDGFAEAVKNTLVERAARGARQVEEHYCRKSAALRGQQVRERIERAIHDANLGEVSHRILNFDGTSVENRLSKQSGLDDGVQLK